METIVVLRPRRCTVRRWVATSLALGLGMLHFSPFAAVEGLAPLKLQRIFYINLERRSWRRLRFEERAEVLGLKPLLSRWLSVVMSASLSTSLQRQVSRGGWIKAGREETGGRGTLVAMTAMFCMYWRLGTLAVSAGLLFGVDLASIGAALEGMSQDLGLEDVHDTRSEWIVSGAKGGAVFGSLFGGAFMVSRGRRTSIICAAIPFLIGPLFAFLGRLLMGLGFGLASVATPSYLSEVVPPVHRGLFEAMYELGIASGMLISSLLNLLLQAMSESGRLGSLGCWRYQAGLVPCAFAVPLLLLALMVPESPRWLLQTASPSPAKLLVSLKAKLLASPHCFFGWSWIRFASDIFRRLRGWGDQERDSGLKR
eukprot:symbB.v1.2.040809.t1/scaffold7551.1/size10645/1